ncbi:hypothetical protein AMATHDRAFT_2103 [Amanita thiersii Skay4041]|uniref:NYN domain-containing protein n=1 Tax=Amanita thiersii Skay4041 TaxID=703135 RepID=A0A2A9NWY9_9AGAR|nr:hypothetical protein AMATHDRAFT_2103 [Amanita thiersii Skay4041]
MDSPRDVYIFWDLVSCSVYRETSIAAVNHLKEIGHKHGTIKQLQTYIDSPVHGTAMSQVMADLTFAGVAVINCPRDGQNTTADRLMTVDMFAHVIDHPHSILLVVTANRNFAYPISILQLRKYSLVIVTLHDAHPSIWTKASEYATWDSDVYDQDVEQSEPPKEGMSHNPFMICELNKSQGAGGSSIHGSHPALDVVSKVFDTASPVINGDSKQKVSSSYLGAVQLPSFKKPSQQNFDTTHRPTSRATSASSQASLSTPSDSAHARDSCESKTHSTVEVKNHWSRSAGPTIHNPPSVGYTEGIDALKASATIAAVSKNLDTRPVSPGPKGTTETKPLKSSFISEPPSAPLHSFDALTSKELLNSTASFPSMDVILNNGTGKQMIPAHFHILVERLASWRENGYEKVSRSTIASELIQHDTNLYRKAGVSKFASYITAAVKAGIVDIGHDSLGAPWIALRKDHHARE